MKTIPNITYPAFTLFAFVCFAFSPDVRAVCQQGWNTTDNTFLGDDALTSNSTGSGNTAIGHSALLPSNSS